MMKARNLNILLILCSVLFTYLVIEFFIFRFAIRHLPLNRHDFLTSSMQVLAQSSKRGLIPQKDYIAVVGDSNAAGYGDWLMDADPNVNSPFHSTHVMHQMTGKDIVSFGKSGRGSLGGIAIQPIEKFESINNLAFYELTEPKCILIYFYEGNDLDNNLKRIEKTYAPAYELEKIYDPSYFRQYISDSIPKRSFSDIFKNFVFGRFVYKMIKKNLDRVFGEAEEIEAESDKYKGTNIVAIGEKKVALPPRLQGPALGFDEEELKLSLYVFNQSLKYIRSYFNHSDFFVVYVPSVLSSYKLVSKYVNERKDGSDIFTPEDVYGNSDNLARKVKEFAEENAMTFIDTRADVRRASEKELLHGPKDWKHLNKKGYETLAASIVEGLKRKGAI